MASGGYDARHRRRPEPFAGKVSVMSCKHCKGKKCTGACKKDKKKGKKK
jgi:hypothetical protein